MYTYIKFVRMSLYSADSNCQVRIGSPKRARNEEDCAHQKVIEKVNFPKRLWGFCARDEL